MEIACHPVEKRDPESKNIILDSSFRWNDNARSVIPGLTRNPVLFCHPVEKRDPGISSWISTLFPVVPIHPGRRGISDGFILPLLKGVPVRGRDFWTTTNPPSRGLATSFSKGGIRRNSGFWIKSRMTTPVLSFRAWPGIQSFSVIPLKNGIQEWIPNQVWHIRTAVLSISSLPLVKMTKSVSSRWKTGSKNGFPAYPSR